MTLVVFDLCKAVSCCEWNPCDLFRLYRLCQSVLSLSPYFLRPVHQRQQLNFLRSHHIFPQSFGVCSRATFKVSLTSRSPHLSKSFLQLPCHCRWRLPKSLGYDILTHGMWAMPTEIYNCVAFAINEKAITQIYELHKSFHIRRKWLLVTGSKTNLRTSVIKWRIA